MLRQCLAQANIFSGLQLKHLLICFNFAIIVHSPDGAHVLPCILVSRYINDNRERELYSPICSVTSVHRRLWIHKFYSPVAKLEFSKSCTRNFNPFSKLYLWSDICDGLRLCRYWKWGVSKKHFWCEHALSVMVAMPAIALLNKTWLIYYYHGTALMFKMFEFRALFCFSI